MTIDLLLDVLLDGALDTLKLMPFLLVTYVAMEALEHGMAGRAEKIISRADKSGPIVGACLGAVPQCGFSAIAATLYSARVVSVGTLLAVILSTSDELIPVFLANQAPTQELVQILITKLVIGMLVGFALDILMRARRKPTEDRLKGIEAIVHSGGHAHVHARTSADAHTHSHEQSHTHNHAHIHAESHVHEHDCGCGHTHIHNAQHGSPWAHIVKSATMHTLEVSLFIFAVTVVFGLGIEMLGEEAIAGFLGNHPMRASFLAALIGLIPNCAASVVISQLYIDGMLAYGPMMAGLLVSGGMGFLVLFRTNPRPAQNLGIVGLVYAIGVAAGLILNLL